MAPSFCDRRPPLIVLTGATATGKTAAAIALARRVSGEIVSADSRQVYRGFDIGTAKPTPHERHQAPHHLIDIVNADEDFSLATYQALAFDAIAAIHERGRVPLLVGGTPLYINAVSAGWSIPQAPPDRAFRAALEAEISTTGLARVEARLASLDPHAATRARGNPRRIIRALEVIHVTGQTVTAQSARGPSPYQVLRVTLSLARPELHARIDARVDAMIRAGLVAEVAGLLACGYAPSSPALSAIGYAEIVNHLAGNGSLDDAIIRIKTNTHRYVRHQETWFRRERGGLRLDVADSAFVDLLEHVALDFLAGVS